MSDQPASKRDLDNLENRVKALESLVISLLATTHDADPAGLREHLEEGPVRISGSSMKPLLSTALKKRAQLLAAADIPFAT